MSTLCSITRWAFSKELAIGSLTAVAALTLTLAQAEVGVGAVGDFDGDGLLDVALLADEPAGPLVAVYLGTGEPAAPFHGIPIQSRIPGTTDILEAGDFDADGRVDLIATTRGRASLTLLAGDGRGSISRVQHLKLAGGVTALAVGEVNRRDGLPDIAVTIDGAGGAALLVFESPQGAIARAPETIRLPAAAAAVAIGEMDNEFGIDIAVASGDELIVVHGRDRRLTLGPRRQPSNPPRSDRFSLSGIRALAFGDALAAVFEDGRLVEFALREDGQRWKLDEVRSTRMADAVDSTSISLKSSFVSSDAGREWIVATPTATRIFTKARGEDESFVAVAEYVGTVHGALPMRLGADALLDLVEADPSGGAPRAASSSFSAVFTVDGAGDGPDASAGDGICDDGSGDCTLRAAIQEANALVGADSISFDIGTGVPTITPSSALPAISEALTILGATGGATRVELDGSSAGSGANGLTVTGDGASIRSLVVNRFDEAGIRLESANNLVADCHVGTDSAGNGTVLGNGDGVLITGAGATGNTIGGTVSSDRNVISNNVDRGIWITGRAGGNTVAGNFIGTDPSGTMMLGNRTGVAIWDNANGNTIGGTTSGPGDPPGNLISGNSGPEMHLRDTFDNLIQGNLIGTDVTGSSRLGGGRLFVEDESPACGFIGCPGTDTYGNTLGGSTTQTRNVGPWIDIFGYFVRDNLVQGNYVCTDVTGAVALGGFGIIVSKERGSAPPLDPDLIGGNTTSPGVPPGNVISGCDFPGVSIGGGDSDDTPKVMILGNMIGVAADGRTALPNAQGGIRFDAVSAGATATVGGADPGDRNLISGNMGPGVELFEQTVVSGNWIGVDIDGAPLPNTGQGVRILGANNLVGGSDPADRNVISCNAGDGVTIDGAGATANVVAGNVIGVAPDGATPCGNGGHGVLISGAAHSNRIGGLSGIVPGDCAGECNLIAHNTLAGVGNLGGDAEIRGNAIRDNGGLGIDHGVDGVTPNDPGDADPPNFPQITSVDSTPGAVAVGGTLDSRPGETFTIDVFGAGGADPSAHGEGDAFIGSTSCIADASGQCTWSVAGPFTAATYTATSTDAGPWTSEFAMNVDAKGPGEASGENLAPLRVTAIDTVNGIMSVSYDAPCAATGHNLEWGYLPAVGSYTWEGQECDIGADGSHSWSYPPGDLFFVMVANNGSIEGSYGRDSAKAERPEDDTSTSCPWPRVLVDRCDPPPS